jgi:hypothetical protein
MKFSCGSGAGQVGKLYLFAQYPPKVRRRPVENADLASDKYQAGGSLASTVGVAGL